MKIDSRRLTLLLAIGLILAALAIFLHNALQPPVVTVAWNTSSELNTAGFNVLRGDTSNGPFTRVNATVIPAANDPLVGGSYTFVDAAVQPGRTYYYRIEEVEFSGGTSQQPDTVIATVEGFQPWLIAAAVGFAVLIIGVLLWTERPRRSSSQT